MLPMMPQADTKIEDYLPVYLDALRIDSVLDFDLYLIVQDKMVLYREKNLSFTESYRQNLLDNQVDKLYIPMNSRKKYQKYIEASLDKIITDERIPEPSKAKIIYDASKELVQDVFRNPHLGENIQRSRKMVEHTISYILRGREALVHILQITSVDYYTYTHSINVCTFTIALARRLGIENQTILHELGIGALLHDIGKSRIPAKVLKKKSALTSIEYDLIKKHPAWGAEILRKTNLISPKSYYPVLQHQERADGSGYPYGLKKQQIHLYGHLTAICDTFDALTTRRTYSEPLSSFAALKIIKEKTNEYDAEFLDEFIKLMGPADSEPPQPSQISRDTVSFPVK